MNENLIAHIQAKIRSLKNEIKAIEYTMGFYDVSLGCRDADRIRECTHKIQVLNEIIISFGIQKQ